MFNVQLEEVERTEEKLTFNIILNGNVIGRRIVPATKENIERFEEFERSVIDYINESYE